MSPLSKHLVIPDFSVSQDRHVNQVMLACEVARGSSWQMTDWRSEQPHWLLWKSPKRLASTSDDPTPLSHPSTRLNWTQVCPMHCVAMRRRQKIPNKSKARYPAYAVAFVSADHTSMHDWPLYMIWRCLSFSTYLCLDANHAIVSIATPARAPDLSHQQYLRKHHIIKSHLHRAHRNLFQQVRNRGSFSKDCVKR